MNDAAPRSSWTKLYRILPNPCGPLTGLPWPSAAACGISAVTIAFSGTLYWTLYLQLRRQRVMAAQPQKSFLCSDALDELLPLSNRSTVNPCLDLHGFVCRQQGVRGVSRSNVFRRAYANVLLDWAALFYGSGSGHLDLHFNMVKRIYRSCILTMFEVGEAERQADIFLHQWGDGWKTIRDNPTRQDLMQLVLSLALTYNISTVLDTFAVLAHRVFPTSTSLRSIQQVLVDCDLHVTSFGQLWNLAITEAVDNSRRRVEAETIISQIRTAVLSRMQTSFFQSNRSTATSTLIQLHLYYPKNTVPRSAALPNISDNFFVNAFRARKYEQSAHLELVATRKMSLFTARLDSELGYFLHENALFISHSSLAPPVFSPDDERFINYARFGALIAGEIYGSILAGTEPEPTDNETNSGFQLNAQRSCFENLYFGHNESMTSTAILDRALSLSHGLETVWQIAKGDIWGHRVALQQHGEVVTWAQMFFLRYCATWCGFYDSDDWNRWSCNVPVRNLMAFHAAFGCPKPDERCLQ
ncbi:hypothetical protein HPB47_000873 [Ixodes persulcatus]|uniref:Uncharacterized protein n=1 Tax=Ixodes persulcatus TaxID=34615 RepID=A0AC60PQQ2_IXOPE|nr:hypothetical protein HPB47_000873 [Ixodes persulcatus]